VALIVQAVLAFALFEGLKVEIPRPSDVAGQLVAIVVPLVPPPAKEPHVAPTTRDEPRQGQSKRSESPVRKGKEGAPPSLIAVAPIVTVRSPAAPAGAGSGAGPGAGMGSGEGEGGNGTGGGGGTELEQIAGEITPRDYPRRLGRQGIGGSVGVQFTVGVDGRVKRCTITHSSGVAELDALTCRLIEERFRYRPSTDRFGRPVPDVVEGEHEWTARP
jgi:protein TonB